MSHMTPSCGISLILSIASMSFMSRILGDRPPWTQNTRSSTTAANVKQSNTSVQARQTFNDPYLRMHSSQKPYTCVISLDQWLPRRRVILFLYLTLRARRRRKVSTLSRPRSTQSPMKIQLVQGGNPPILNSSNKSSNWPWISPQMVTGLFTLITLLSSFIIYLAESQIFFTRDYQSFSPFLRVSIMESSYFRVAIQFYVTLPLQINTNEIQICHLKRRLCSHRKQIVQVNIRQNAKSSIPFQNFLHSFEKFRDIIKMDPMAGVFNTMKVIYCHLWVQLLVFFYLSFIDVNGVGPIDYLYWLSPPIFMKLKISQIVKLFKNGLQVGDPFVSFLPLNNDISFKESCYVLRQGPFFNISVDLLCILLQIYLIHFLQHIARIFDPLVLFPRRTIDIYQNDPVNNILQLWIFLSQLHQSHCPHRVSHQYQSPFFIQFLLFYKIGKIIGQVLHTVCCRMWRISMISTIDQIAVYIVGNVRVFAYISEIFSVTHETMMDYHITRSREIIVDVIEGD